MPKHKSPLDRVKKSRKSKRRNSDDALYAFYYSLYLEDPSNKMARNWLIDNGYMNRFNVQSLTSELDEIENSMFPSHIITDPRGLDPSDLRSNEVAMGPENQNC